MLTRRQAYDVGVLEQHVLTVLTMLEDPDRYRLDYTYEAGFVRFVAGIGEYLGRLRKAESNPAGIELDQYGRPPWQAIVGLRHIASHEYDVLDAARVWADAAAGTPALHKAL